MRPRRPDGRRGRAPAARRLSGLAVCACLLGAAPAAAAGFADWQYRQALSISAPGLVKLSLPPETLDAALAGLEDLRVLDASGAEVPYVIERATAAAKVVREAASFRATLAADVTVLTLETGLAQPLDAVTLVSPADRFIKAVQAEGSADGAIWRVLTQGVPIFRQLNGAGQLRIPLPPGVWRFLRLTVDDRRSPPVPFTGARVHAAAPEPVPLEPAEVRIAERIEAPGETRLTLNLGAARIHLAALHLESPDPLFTRRVTLAVRQVEEDGIREKPLAEGVIYRVALSGRPAASQLALPVEAVAPSRELLLLVRNDDSPPLQIPAVRAQRRPAFVVFLARQPGAHAILTGNRHARAPRYDLAALGVHFKAAAVSSARPSALAPNPDYRPAEPLADVPAVGAALDVSAWAYRKRTQPAAGGVQQIEIDVEVLAHALPSLADVRLVSDGRQLPYILEHTTIGRPLVPQVTAATDPRNPRVTRWTLKVSHGGLPVTRLRCTARTPLFRREVALYEEVADERGARRRRPLGRAAWVRTPDREAGEQALDLTATPTTDTLVLETDNGDNPPVELDGFQFFYGVKRILFKGAADTHLYYGNRRAGAPRYDLGLVAAQMLGADKAVASLGPEERVGKGPWPDRTALAGKSGVVFWGVLAVVVAILLFVIARLLPKGAAPPPA